MRVRALSYTHVSVTKVAALEMHVFTDNTAICDPACLNGGRCHGPNQCTCTAEYTGSQCGEGKLDISIIRSYLVYFSSANLSISYLLSS